MDVPTIRAFAAVLLVAALSCAVPRGESATDGGGVTNPTGGTPGGGRGGAGAQSLDAPQVGETVHEDPSCPKGQHKCGDVCVDSTSVMTCGAGCTPCPAPTGGTATCDGVKCGVTCPQGQKPCRDACVAEATTCDQSCPSGQNNCGGICVDAKSLSTCGPMCTSCPASPNGAASCDGEKCTLKCNAGFHKCGDACVSDTDIKSCGTACSPCEAPMGGSATCDGVKCGTQCPGGTQLCLGSCVPMGQACQGVCPQGKHDCAGNCVSNSEIANCGTACTPCKPPENADATCDGTTCAFTCRAGFHQCGSECKSNMSVDSCGTSCERCPAPAGGTPTCNGTACDFRCDTGRKCGSACISDEEACNGSCGSGRTLCMGTGKCVLSSSITAERCDGQDNDCDGQIDEGLTDNCQNKCGTRGTARCVNGNWDRSGCPADPQCCNDSDCGGCQKCNGGRCGGVSCGQCEECNNNHGCRPKERGTRCGTGYCDGGNCRPGKDAGAQCSNPYECKINRCTGGICCRETCGFDQRCVGDGVCRGTRGAACSQLSGPGGSECIKRCWNPCEIEATKYCTRNSECTMPGDFCRTDSPSCE